MSFLTGGTKFSKVSIFSDLNNLDDITFDREYSSICGITEEKILSNFMPEVQEMANEYNESYDNMLAILRRKYDGYRFGRNEERIYNPFSLFNVKAKTDNAIYNFEFKVGGKPPDAIIQIKDAGYAEKYGASSKDIFLIGATISRNRRTLSKWEVEKVRVQ